MMVAGPLGPSVPGTVRSRRRAAPVPPAAARSPPSVPGLQERVRRPVSASAAPAAAPPTGAAFLDCLKRSGLVSKEKLATFSAAAARDLPHADGPVLAANLVKLGFVTRWQADKLLAGRCRGFRLGSYKLMSLLGKGGMSAVYLAEHVVMKRRCAVKVLPAKLTGSGSHMQRFLREARAVAALDHPNIVRAYDIATEGEGDAATHFLVMELVEGRSLYDLVKREGPPDHDRVRFIGRECAKGLGHAHAAGIVHRDVKPGNVLLADSGAVKITDLGLARGDDEEHSLTVAHDEKVLGTADYLAPEQALDSHTVDYRADIYGLGCTLYFTLCGHGPFTEGTLAQRLLAHQTKPAPPIETVAEAVPDDLAEAIGRMLEKKADDRYQTMEEVVAALTPPDAETPSGAAAPEPAAPVEPELGDFLAGFTGEPDSAARSGLRPAVKRRRSGGRRGRTRDAPSGTETPSGAGGPATPPPGSGDASSTTGGTASSTAAGTAAPTGSHGGADDNPFGFLDGGDDDPPSNVSGAFIAGPGSGRVPDAPTPSPASGTHAAGDEPDAASVRRPLPGKSRWPLLAAAGAGVLTAAALLGWVLLGGGSGDGDGGGGADGASAEEIETRPAGPLTVGAGGDYPTIAAVLDYLRNDYRSSAEGPTVRLPAGALAEGLDLDNSDFGFPSGVRFVGHPDGTTLDPPGGRPAILLKGVTGYTLENLTVDAEGRAVAIELDGYLAGARLKNLTVKNVTGAALALDDVGSDELRIENLAAEAAPGASDAVGVLLTGGGTNGVTVSGGSLTGFAPAVNVAADAVDVTFENLTIGPSPADGVRLGQVKLKDFVLRGNTFTGVSRGIVFTADPRGGSGGIVIVGNAFGDATVPVAVKGPAGPVKANLNAAASTGNTADNPGDDPLELFK